jgi:DMSO/TMAO reductase YedYZ molybdopterin-dependent catalytic subunit
MKKSLRIMVVAATVFIMLAVFITSVFSQEPSPDLGWTLEVDGSVQNPRQFTLADLISMPATTVTAQMKCIDQIVAEGDWTGVKLWLVLENAGIIIDQNATVNFEAADGYEVKDFPLGSAMRDDVLIAYKLNGQFLNETIRLAVPGAQVTFWIFQVTRITVKASTAVIPEFPSSIVASLVLLVASAVTIACRKRRTRR